MKLKSFFADSTQEAIDKARMELGQEVMLMSAKETDFELRALGSIEVTFGIPNEVNLGNSHVQAKSAGRPRVPVSSGGKMTAETIPAYPVDLASQLAELRDQIAAVSQSLQHSTSAAPAQKPLSAPDICLDRLRRAGLSETLAQEIVDCVGLQTTSSMITPELLNYFDLEPQDSIGAALISELENRLSIETGLGVPGAERRIVLFVGPTGSGKTTSLIKLGFRFGLQEQAPVHLISLDTSRVGGWETLASYAQIAGLGFDAAHSIVALESLLGNVGNQQLVLIDSPGYGPTNGEAIDEIADWLDRTHDIDVQLVVPATLRHSVLSRTLAHFSRLKPHKLILTRADEVESSGALLDTAIQAKMPLSYVSHGQAIPEDIEEASKVNLLAGLDLKCSHNLIANAA